MPIESTSKEFANNIVLHRQYSTTTMEFNGIQNNSIKRTKIAILLILILNDGEWSRGVVKGNGQRGWAKGRTRRMAKERPRGVVKGRDQGEEQREGPRGMAKGSGQGEKQRGGTKGRDQWEWSRGGPKEMDQRGVVKGSGQGEWSRGVAKGSGQGEWPRGVVKGSGQGEWPRGVVKRSGQGEWSRGVAKVGTNYMVARTLVNQQQKYTKTKCDTFR